MKRNKLPKILMSITTLIICTFGCFMFSKIMFANMHVHPPTEHDIKKIRDEIKKNIEKHGNEDAKKQAKKGNLPFIRKPKKK